MEKNSHKLLSLNQIFQGKYFVIPDYQRGYSWEKQHREDLLDDLAQIEAGTFMHFTGTIVAALSENSKDHYEIVDGQQRLTTLVILISVLHQKIGDHDGMKNNFLYSGEEAGNTIYKLTLNRDLHDFYVEFIKYGKLKLAKETTKSKRNLREAYQQFEKWANKKKTPELKQYYNLITMQLGFIFYTPQNSREIGIMFEVINNRGKKLSELEKVKNYLVYLATKFDLKDLENTILNSWGTILSNLSSIGWHTNQNEDAFLKNCWIVFENPTKKISHHVYDNLKKSYPSEKAVENWEKLDDFVSFMVKASESIKDLYLNNESGVRLHISQHPNIASILPAYLAIDIKLEDGEEKNKCLSLLEKLNFRFYVTGIAKRSDSGQSDMFWFAHHFYNKFGEITYTEDEEDEEDEVINAEWMLNKMTYFIEDYANDTSFIRSLTLDKDESGHYINWQGLKYFLCCYEVELAEKKGRSFDIRQALSSRKTESKNDFYHREHIWAIKEYTLRNDSKKLDINKRRLGNFVLLKEVLNIRVSQKPVMDKIGMYRLDSKEDLNTRMLLELPKMWDDIYEQEATHWGRKTKNFHHSVIQQFIDHREQKLINFAITRWRVDELDRKAMEVTVDSFAEGNEVFRAVYDKEKEEVAFDD